MIEIERKTMIISTILVLAILSGIALMTYVNANGLTNDTSTTANVTSSNYRGIYNNTTGPFFGRRGFGGRCGGLGGPITVSQEYKDNVINITESDSDVQTLLAEGYNITGVRPIITTSVGADGIVTMKATTAIVSLQKDTAGRALVWVNVEQAKVTRIEILTITVIEKA